MSFVLLGSAKTLPPRAACSDPVYSHQLVSCLHHLSCLLLVLTSVVNRNVSSCWLPNEAAFSLKTRNAHLLTLQLHRVWCRVQHTLLHPHEGPPNQAPLPRPSCWVHVGHFKYEILCQDHPRVTEGPPRRTGAKTWSKEQLGVRNKCLSLF